MKKAISRIAAAAALALIVWATVSGVIATREKYVFLDWQMYPRDTRQLDLREEDVSFQKYEALQELLPDCEILWNVPFQGSTVSSDSKLLRIQTITDEEMDLLAYLPQLQVIDGTASRDYDQLLKLQEAYPQLEVLYEVLIDGEAYAKDAQTVTVKNLTEEEVILMDYLPQLQTVRAQQCRDYDCLVQLQERRPQVETQYSVSIGGIAYPSDTAELAFDNVKVADIAQELSYLRQLERIHLTQPEAEAQELVQLTQDHPGVEITWEKTVFGRTFRSTDEEIDLSRLPVTTEEVEEAMAFFPNAQKVIMSDCGIDNETMAEFREKMRPEYKVVWTVIVTGERVRTDDTVFHSSGRHVALVDELSNDLYYCEDMIVVDIGHSYVKYIEWVKGMPNLKYLILADNWIKDITPISTCKNLIYLELFINEWLKDLSPLVGCTALEDLSVSDTYADLTPLAQMPWLKNLWANNCNATREEREALEKGLPNTHLAIDIGTTTGGGWRQLQNYFDMRDIMGLPYNPW